jgi:demethylmenaquinone methyltransferase/2-methoxy-6-polyprenyl-1,4-benzoquinol methylase
LSDLTGPARSAYVRQMFSRIADRYDFLNRLMTIGQDKRWRREVVSRTELEAQAFLLDLGAGTGDLAFEAIKQHPEAFVVAADFTPEMLWVGRARGGSRKIHWILCDALHLPFREESFHAVVHGFLMRNVSDSDRVIGEQYRVLSGGGRMVSLDTTPPDSNFLRPLIEFHFHFVIPTLGKWFAGDASAYTYLPDSTEKFLTAEAYRGRIQAAGFEDVGFVKRMLGTIGIHWGRKSAS